jgi:hypothetical protein
MIKGIDFPLPEKDSRGHFGSKVTDLHSVYNAPQENPGLSPNKTIKNFLDKLNRLE